MTDKQWAKCFRALQVDILDRKGLKWAWQEIDDEVISEEISPEWRRIIENATEEA